MKPLDHYEMILAYHERTKHHFERYARGPGQINWDSQPDAFRRYSGAQCFELPLVAESLNCSYTDLYHPKTIAPRQMTLSNISALLELSLGLSAWKQYGEHRWVLRCNPSSGNLHPTEAYIILPNITSLPTGVYHYLSYEHLLEQRGFFETAIAATFEKTLPPACFLFGLSSIPWREVWKYGERAFRYCQLDIGHAIGAVRYAAATLGWTVQLLDYWSDSEMSIALGLNQEEDFEESELEIPEMILCINTQGKMAFDFPYSPTSANNFLKRGGKNSAPPTSSFNPFEEVEQRSKKPIIVAMESIKWVGKANVLDKNHCYEWPIIENVAVAATRPVTEKMNWIAPPLPPLMSLTSSVHASNLIQQRRSTQLFDSNSTLDLKSFYRLLDATLPRANIIPWDTFQRLPHIHLVLFVHRIRGLAPGIYILLRKQSVKEKLQIAFNHEFSWKKPDSCPDYLPLYQLISGDAKMVAQQIFCNQEIASDGAFSISMLAEFEETLKNGAWYYKHLLWEAGLIGQVLYLESEAAGVRGTGVGCFFDDALHTMLGLTGIHYQSVYHFTIGTPSPDKRLQTFPPYEHLHGRVKINSQQ
ncbi:MAG: SagB/ThcOx family dehydrogenase [Thiomargarita sp.]|nr:SagB/ThcOx family dehydrogenase [Thiomargarita sp.]